MKKPTFEDHKLNFSGVNRKTLEVYLDTHVGTGKYIIEEKINHFEVKITDREAYKYYKGNTRR